MTTHHPNIDSPLSSTQNNNYQLFSPLQQNRLLTQESIVIDTIIYNIQNNIPTSSTSSFISSNNFIPFHIEDDYPSVCVSSFHNTIEEREENKSKITKEELEIINKKKTLVNLSKIIEKYLLKNPKKMYNLTKYTLFEIDEIQADIFISTEIDDETGSELYFYKIISKNIYYELDDNDSISEENVKDLVIYDNYGFDNLICLLEDVKYVEQNYKILDYYLLSPEHMLEALAQREFIPIHPDKICSVCYDPTIEFTICKHSICLKCREKCIVQEKKTCPICRNSNLCIYPVTL